MARANACSHTIPRHRHHADQHQQPRASAHSDAQTGTAYDKLYQQQKILLDPATRVQIVKDTQRTRLGMLGLTILVVTHDLGLAWNVADRLAVMDLGRIVEQGPTEQVLAAPGTPTPARC
jgi:ABC-type proline/glycine betaine transport system ATPase subunit